MTTDPDQIRGNIEQTQQNLSADVDALTEKVSPPRIMERRVQQTRSAMTTMKDRIMGGTADRTSNVGETVSSTASSAKDTLASTASSAADVASAAPEHGPPANPGKSARGRPDRVRRGMAARLLAARHRAGTANRVAGEGPSYGERPAAQQLGQAGQEAAQELRESAQQRAQSVKETATGAASTVTDEAQSRAADVTGHAQEARGRVTEQARPGGS